MVSVLLTFCVRTRLIKDLPGVSTSSLLRSPWSGSQGVLVLIPAGLGNSCRSIPIDLTASRERNGAGKGIKLKKRKGRQAHREIKMRDETARQSVRQIDRQADKKGETQDPRRVLVISMVC